MATVIDSLIVTLGLDDTEYKKNSAKAKKTTSEFQQQATRSTKERDSGERKLNNEQRKRQVEIDSRSKKQVDSMRTMRNEALKLAAVFIGGAGLIQFTANTINGAASLGFLSANLQMSTEDITAFQRASERAGGTAEGMTAQFRESVDTLAQLKLGFGPSAGLQAFFRFGGSSKDLQDGNTYLMARSKIIADMFAIDPGKAMLGQLSASGH